MKILRRIGRYSLLAIAGLVALVLVVAVGMALWLRTSLPQLDGEKAIAGVTAPVTVARDRYGIPHIKAGSLNEAYRALGFVHAQDRLFQMEMMRRAGRGRLSEVVGATTVGIDRRMRIFGVANLAEQEAAALDPEQRALFQAYADGINAFVAANSLALPPEFLLVPGDWEPWKPADSLIWLKLMSLILTADWSDELERAALAQDLSPAQIADLYPQIEGLTTLGSALPDGLSPGAIRHALDVGAVYQEGYGSNLWLHPGETTETGKPILANDPHLGFGIPNTWYLARIETPEAVLAGATAPGFPLIVLGHNGNVAWAFTNGASDTSDVFIERVTEGRPDHYDTPEGSQPFDLREEVIGVRFGDPETVTVRSTRHGPVISDGDASRQELAGEGRVLALAHTGLRANLGNIKALVDVQRVQTVEELRAALEGVGAPQQNIAFADTQGGSGYFAPALVPIRDAPPSPFPVPGWTGEHDWRGFIPYDLLPQRMNPTVPLINANNRPVGEAYPYPLGTGFTSPLRAEAIRNALETGKPMTVTDSQRAQSDAISLAAARLSELAGWAGMADAAPEGVAAAMEAWDGGMNRDRLEPLVFYAWFHALTRRVLADELGDKFPLVNEGRITRMIHLFRHAPGWCDDRTTAAVESCADISRLALADAMDLLVERHGADWHTWRWGDAHFAEFPHRPFGMIPVVGGLFNVRVENDGDRYTSNAGIVTFDERRLFQQVHGAGYRAVYDLADLNRSRFMQAVGQSGNIYSPHYADLALLWAKGETVSMGPLQPGEEANVLRLVPAE